MKAHLTKPLEHICSTLVRLLTECRATSISLCVSAICFDATFLEIVLSALTGPAEVNTTEGALDSDDQHLFLG